MIKQPPENCQNLFFNKFGPNNRKFEIPYFPTYFYTELKSFLVAIFPKTLQDQSATIQAVGQMQGAGDGLNVTTRQLEMV